MQLEDKIDSLEIHNIDIPKYAESHVMTLQIDRYLSVLVLISFVHILLREVAL